MKIPISKSLFTCALLAIGILFGISGPSARAAVIWQTPTTISANSDVSKQGTLLQAYNLGQASPGSVIVNGVTFINNIPSGSPPTVGTGEGTLTLSGSWPTFTGAGSAAAPFSSLSSEYQALLGVASYTGAATPTLTFINLVVGQEYLVQFWAHDSRNLAATWKLTLDGSVVLDYNNGTQPGALGGVGQYVIGTFTATSASQTIAPTGNIQLNAFQIRSIPEPGTASLALAATGILLLQRRRKS